MYRHVLLVISLFMVMAAFGGCAMLRSQSVVEILEIATRDGDRIVREPMRPIRGGTRVLIFALDGVGRGDFLRAVRSGRMPHVAELLGSYEGGDRFANAYAAPKVMSVLPSSTSAAWTSVFSGHPPAETGIPGNEWFDRAEMRFYAPSPVTTERRYQVLRMYNEDVLGDLLAVPTLYERADLRAHVSLSRVYRGADMLNVPEVEPFGSIFNAALRNFFGADSSRHRLYARVDEVSIKSLDESLDRYGFADLQTVYLPGSDLFTHIAATPIESQQHYLQEVTDPAVGAVLKRYRDKGLLNRTYVLFISDHGQTPVANEDRNSLWREGEDEPPTLLEKAGFRVRPWGLKTDRGDEDYQAVLAFQGGTAFVYLADRSTCPDPGMRCDWTRPPRMEEDVMPVVRAFEAANRTGVYVRELQDSLDLILAREGAAPGPNAPPFQVFDGTRLIPIEQYLAGTPRPDLPALRRRLNDLSVGPYGYRAGDLLLLSKMSLDEPESERTYFGRGYHTWHGSANRSDSETVFVLSNPCTTGASLQSLVSHAVSLRSSQMAVTPLVLSLLDRRTESCAGREQ